MEKEIIFITLCDNYNKINYLEISCKIWKIKNLNCIILDEWKGYQHKIIELRKLIKNISDDTIVCFIDAYDVIFSSQNDDIFDKFINLNCNILFSAELFCYPENNAKYYNDLKLYNSNSNFKYLNSGGYIGYNKYIKKMLEWKSDDDIIDICKNCGDQNYFTLYFLENWNTENIKLDINQEIFQSMCGLNYYKDFIFINGKLYNKALKKYPSIIHFNGFGDMEIKKAKNILTGSNENIIKKFIDLMIESKINESIINIYYIYPFKVLNQITA